MTEKTDNSDETKKEPEEVWKDPENYKYLKDLSRIGLAWECLKRNPDFQHDMHLLANDEYPMDIYGHHPEDPPKFLFGKKTGKVYLDPALRDGQSVKEWLITNGARGKLLNLQEMLQEKWLMTGLPVTGEYTSINPDQDLGFHYDSYLPNLLFGEDIIHYPYEIIEEKGVQFFQVPDGKIIIEFSLHTPTKFQIDEARRQISRAKKSKIANAKLEAVRNSLRVWDAINTTPKMSLDKIEKEIFYKNQTSYENKGARINASIKTADRMILKKQYHGLCSGPALNAFASKNADAIQNANGKKKPGPKPGSKNKKVPKYKMKKLKGKKKPA